MGGNRLPVRGLNMYIGFGTYEFQTVEAATRLRDELKRRGIASWLLRPVGACYSWHVFLVPNGPTSA